MLEIKKVSELDISGQTDKKFSTTLRTGELPIIIRQLK